MGQNFDGFGCLLYGGVIREFNICELWTLCTLKVHAEISGYLVVVVCVVMCASAVSASMVKWCYVHAHMHSRIAYIASCSSCLANCYTAA